MTICSSGQLSTGCAALHPWLQTLAPLGPGMSAYLSRHNRLMKKKANESKKAVAASDWRTDLLDQIRALIQEADPGMVEEHKWKKPTNPAGVPVWSHDGIVCTGETYKNAVKMTFMKGASLKDPAGLFNSGLDGNTRRAIDFKE